MPNDRDKNEFLLTANYFSYFYSLLLLPPKRWYRMSPALPPLHTLLYRGHLLLVGCCVLVSQLAAA